MNEKSVVYTKASNLHLLRTQRIYDITEISQRLEKVR
jgi:hypothetical protein